MILLKIDNSYSKVEGLTVSQHKKLADALSYTVDKQASFFSGGYGPRKKTLLDKKGYFPTGLHMRFSEFCAVEKVTLNIQDLRKQPYQTKTITMVEPMYAWQENAIEEAIFRQRGIISAPTGSGKSRVILGIATRLNLKTLIVVPSLEIKRQLAEDMKHLPNVVVENIDSTALKSAKDYDVLIIDEAHHVASKTYQKLNKTAWNSIYYRFFLSATPFRNDTEETLLFESIAGQVIYRLSYKEAVKNNYIVPIEAYYIEMPKTESDAYTWAEVYSQHVVHNSARNEAIAILALRLNKQDKSTLILVKEIAHGEALERLTNLPFANGQDETTRDYIRQFNNGEIKVLIGTEGILGEGVDTKPCEYVIIAGLGKAKSAFMQKVGRCIRTYPGKESGKVILIKDRSHRYPLRHFRQQCTILRDEYDAVATKIEL